MEIQGELRLTAGYYKWSISFMQLFHKFKRLVKFQTRTSNEI
jgi:hypothetical protein